MNEGELWGAVLSGTRATALCAAAEREEAGCRQRWSPSNDLRLTPHWPECGHMTISSCKGAWESWSFAESYGEGRRTGRILRAGAPYP